MKIFISHCSSDTDFINEYLDIFAPSKKDKVFFSSSPETGIDTGGEIVRTINKRIEECDKIVCIITENYVRSAFCIYELNIATYLANKKRTIVPIVVNSSIYSRIEPTIKHLDMLYMDASKKEEFDVRFLKMFPGANENKVEEFRQQMSLADHSERAFVGMETKFFKDVISYCEKHHIKAINNTFEDGNTLVQRVKNAKEVTIISTTGSAIIKRLSTEAFYDALLNGVKIRIIVPNQYSNFLLNVAQLERPENPYARFEELNHEYEAAMGYLIEVYQKAKKVKDDIGTIEYFCSYNMLRQTVILVKGEDDVFASLSLTVPPKKTIDGTPTIVIDSKNEEKVLADILEKHCLSIMGVAKNSGDYFLIDEKMNAHPFFLEKESAKIYWHNKYNQAQALTKEQRSLSNDILIEVAAQHPLEKDGSPRKEFKMRLDEGYRLYKKYKEEGIDVKIYVPGSVHKYHEKVDVQSLSTSGKKYLISLGMDEKDIYADEMNEKYKGEDGVYNSADECYVSTKLFFDESFGRLISVCSPNQLLRKTLFYIEFGVIPEVHSVPVDDMYHDLMNEVFVNLEYVIYKDHNGQDKTSELFISSRKERKPE